MATLKCIRLWIHFKSNSQPVDHKSDALTMPANSTPVFTETSMACFCLLFLPRRLPCSMVTYSLLGSYLAQSLLGDYDPAEHGTSCDYLSHIQFAPSTCQSSELLSNIAELHRSRRGQSPTSAELEYLINASRLAMYGIDIHPVLVIIHYYYY